MNIKDNNASPFVHEPTEVDSQGPPITYASSTLYASSIESAYSTLFSKPMSSLVSERTDQCLEVLHYLLDHNYHLVVSPPLSLSTY